MYQFDCSATVVPPRAPELPALGIRRRPKAPAQRPLIQRPQLCDMLLIWPFIVCLGPSGPRLAGSVPPPWVGAIWGAVWVPIGDDLEGSLGGRLGNCFGE